MTDFPAQPGPTAAPPLMHVDALPVGTRLAEFEVQSLLGVGGFGMVYRAYDHSLHRTVAIKEYMPAALASRQNGLSVSVRSSVDKSTYESGLKSFVAEARLLAQFDHPSLVKVYRFWEANNTAYMVMPLYSGITLKQARSQMSAPPPEAWLRTVLWSILQALQVLHKANTLHRDVSPDNIFLQDMGPPVLLDLGAARKAISDKSHKLTAILKVNYAPIEQYAEAEDMQQGPWTDLYSLAAVVYTCLRNDPPLPATSRVVRDKLPSLASVVRTLHDHFGQDYSAEFVSAISHALAVQPEDRPQSVQAFIAEMRLEAVEELAKFDWRVDIGSALLPATEETSRSLWATQSQTVPAEREPTGSDQEVTLAPAPRKKAKAARKRGKTMAWLLAATLVLAGLAFWIVLGTDLLGDAQVVAAPEPAATPVAAAPEPAASEPVAVASEPVAAPAPPVIHEPATAVYEPAASPVPAHPVAPHDEAKAALPEHKKETADSGKAAGGHTTAARKPASTKTAPPPVRELCADTHFLLRPICIHAECQKAENASLPVCIEDRKRNTFVIDPVRP